MSGETARNQLFGTERKRSIGARAWWQGPV